MATTHQQRSSYALLSKQEILGYVTVHHPENGCLMIDEVAVDKKCQGQKLSGILIRFGETLARQSDCRMVRLYAISTKVELYKKFGYHVLSEKSIRLEDEEYILMERALLHRLPEPPPLPPDC
ncbi:MAG: GNAT family N-acetyltransferase [Verrucomicrobiota bacterium]